jgi:hypothetical protein
MRFASAGFGFRSYMRAELDPINQISRFTKLKLVICARTGDRAALLFGIGSIAIHPENRAEEADPPLALQAPHGSGALVTAVHCFRIVFSIAPRWTAPL